MFEHPAFERRGPGTKVSNWPYENRANGGEVVAALAEHDVKIAIVSDFHVDLRPHLAWLGLLDLISGFALSGEVGVARPHPMMFQAALDMVAVSPERCLMVGDNPTPDTGASVLGIATLIPPLQRATRPPLLERVLSLVGVGSVER